MKKWMNLALLVLLFSTGAFGQVRKIPASVTEAFSKKYPTALDVEYRDVLTSVNVHFNQDSAKWIARYSPKGVWKETEKEWSFDRLSPEIKDGFSKSKFANEWKVTETAVIYLPSGEERYRLKAEKSDLQKKYLYFDKSGRLLRDSLTL